MARALPLGLRNGLAELILAAFDSEAARETLRAVAALEGEAEVAPAAAARLRELGWVEPAGRGRIRLRGAHRAAREPLCRRAAAALSVLGAPSPPPGDPLARAARLADAGLFFEVHELLEPAWLRADGGARLALQGLIQVAVAFHHAQHDNRAGAASLLAEALTKLRAAGSALPLDTAGWAAALDGVLAAWRTGAPAPAVPRWPAPTEAAWHCS